MSSSGDWIKLHRSMEDSVAMSDDWLCRLWITCLLKANWKVGFFKGYQVKPGQFAFSQRLWCEQMQVSRNKLSRGLKILQNAGQIELKTGQQFSIVTICNWGTYQDGDKAGRATNGATNDTTNDTTNEATEGPPTEPQKVNDRRREEGKKERTKEKAASAACTEPAKADVVPADSVLEFSVTGKAKTWHLTAGKLAEWQATFDTLDVLAECRKARQWILDNPAKRKTGRGMPAFLGRWLTRAVDSGRGRASGPSKPKGRAPDHSGLQAFLEKKSAEGSPPALVDHSADYDGEVPF